MPWPRRLRAALVALAPAALLATAAGAEPIPDPAPSTLPVFVGSAATPRPFATTVAPQNRFMASNPNGNLHDDPWMTDAYQRAGPVGRGLQATSSALPAALCGSLTFDSHGRIVTVCPSIAQPITARVIDPETLSIRASHVLGAPNPSGPTAFQNFTGGGYFFLDRRDRIWSATKDNHIVVLAERDDGRRLVKAADYDLTRVLARDDRVTSALPDFGGRVWFVSKRAGTVGVLDTGSRRIRAVTLGEEIENSFAVDRHGVYIASDRRLYRFTARHGRPRIAWKVTYRNSGVHKPGQVDAGTGTTPTVMSGGMVAITDNDDPMNVVVYRTATRLPAGVRRQVCEVPVFAKGASATENSLIGSGRSLFVENNYGYRDPFGPQAGAVTASGFARVDVDHGGKGCTKRWTTADVRAPSVVPKLSTATGLIYTYERPAAPAGEQPYFWVAIDARTGRTVFKRYAGSGLSFNNNYAGIAIGPDGSAYLGVIGGIARLRDGPAAAATAQATDRRRATELGRQAYEYGLPLLEFLRVWKEQTSVKAPDAHADAPVNQLGRAASLASPSDTTVVAPNVDTLYSIAHLDLGREPMVLSHPAMGDRYFSFELLDPYTNVVGYVGTRTTGSRARRTAIAWSGRPARVPSGVRVLRVPYRRIWVIGRTLVRGRPDLAAARRLMRRFTLVPLSRLRHPPRPPARRPGRPTKARLPTGIAFFDALATALAQNPPPRRDRSILARLAEVGIGPGRGPTASRVSPEVRQGLLDGFRQGRAEVAARVRSEVLAGAQASGGWYTPDRRVGDYRTDYTLRAQIAVAGLGANTPAEATYPIALADVEGRLLDGARRYTVTFPPGEVPPVRAFWSLTMYTLDGFLVPNAAHVYAIGDTHPPLLRRPDGSIVVAIQRQRPADATVNWLPAPAGPFRLSLRLYWPGADVLTGRWKPPPVVPVP